MSQPTRSALVPRRHLRILVCVASTLMAATGLTSLLWASYEGAWRPTATGWLVAVGLPVLTSMAGSLVWRAGGSDDGTAPDPTLGVTCLILTLVALFVAATGGILALVFSFIDIPGNAMIAAVAALVTAVGMLAAAWPTTRRWLGH